MRNFPYDLRATKMAHPIAKRLLTLMANKQTNVALVADLTRQADILTVADKLGPEICILKIHVDIISDFDQHFPQHLKKLAQKHQFLIFEDRKFADIGHTVQQQFTGGIYHIADWADIINAYALPGEGMIDALKINMSSQNQALLLIAEMSSAGNLITSSYVHATVELAKRYKDIVIGFISQQRLIDNPDFIYITPGISTKIGSDPLGQRYITPETAINEKGSDIVLIGRSILQQTDPLITAQTLRQRSWQSYLQRIELLAI